MSLEQYNRSRRDELSPLLDDVYVRIHSQAPSAQLLVLGYPNLFPETSDEQNCGKLRQIDYVRRSGWRFERRSIGFSQTEQNYLRQATSELNQLVAARVAASGVATFVSVDGRFAGHEICGESGEWINAATLAGPRVTQVFRTNDQSFHPNSLGHEFGYAAAINDALTP